MDETRDEALKIAKKLSDKDMQKDVDKVRRISPIDELRMSIFNFYQNRMATIEKDERLKEIIEDTLVAKIEDDELSTSQLIRLLSQTKSLSNDATEKLLAVLKPTPNATTILDKKEELEHIGDDPFDNISKEDSQAIATLTRMMLSAKNKKLGTEIETTATTDDDED